MTLGAHASTRLWIIANAQITTHLNYYSTDSADLPGKKVPSNVQYIAHVKAEQTPEKCPGLSLPGLGQSRVGGAGEAQRETSSPQPSCAALLSKGFLVRFWARSNVANWSPTHLLRATSIGHTVSKFRARLVWFSGTPCSLASRAAGTSGSSLCLVEATPVLTGVPRHVEDVPGPRWANVAQLLQGAAAKALLAASVRVKVLRGTPPTARWESHPSPGSQASWKHKSVIRACRGTVCTEYT